MLAFDAQAVSFVDAVDDPVLEPAPGETPLWNRTVTIGLFREDADLDPLIAALQENLPEGDALQTHRELIEDQDWVRVWLKDCPPLKFGERLWVCPREKPVHEAGTETLLLDPGLAFGTGTHPTTAMCLEWLATNNIDGVTAIDFGCGSGILGIAALRLGASSVTGYDIDPQAIQATLENAESNGVLAGMKTVPAQSAFEPFEADLVLANILARPLIELAPLLVQCVKPGGHIVLAGLLDRQAEEVRAAYAGTCNFEPDVSREGWTRLVARRR